MASESVPLGMVVLIMAPTMGRLRACGGGVVRVERRETGRATSPEPVEDEGHFRRGRAPATAGREPRPRARTRGRPSWRVDVIGASARGDSLRTGDKPRESRLSRPERRKRTWAPPRRAEGAGAGGARAARRPEVLTGNIAAATPPRRICAPIFAAAGGGEIS